LQNLRDPLHFRAVAAQVLQDKKLGQSQPGASVAPMHTYLQASGIEKLQLEGRKRASGRWTGKRGSTAKKQKTKPRNDSSAGSKRLI
jgi:hypothetical protein